MGAALTIVHGNRRANEGAEEDPVNMLADTLNDVSSRVHAAQEGGSLLVDTELADLLAALAIPPGEPANDGDIKAGGVWAKVEDQQGVVEALRLDAVAGTTEQLGVLGTTAKIAEMMRARFVGARHHILTPRSRRTSALWRRRRKTVAMLRPLSFCRGLRW